MERSCVTCQARLDDSWFFCPHCGTELADALSNCDNVVDFRPDSSPKRQHSSRTDALRTRSVRDRSENQGSYGPGVRAQVFEVIVRQALAGAPWQEICRGPMMVNGITVSEVEAEVNRRRGLLDGTSPMKGANAASGARPREKLKSIRRYLAEILHACPDDFAFTSAIISMLEQLNELLGEA